MQLPVLSLVVLFYFQQVDYSDVRAYPEERRRETRYVMMLPFDSRWMLLESPPRLG